MVAGDGMVEPDRDACMQAHAAQCMGGSSEGVRMGRPSAHGCLGPMPAWSTMDRRALHGLDTYGR